MRGFSEAILLTCSKVKVGKFRYPLDSSIIVLLFRRSESENLNKQSSGRLWLKLMDVVK